MKNVIIVHRHLADEAVNLKELQSLAESAGYTVVGSLLQTRRPDPKYQIGRGKTAELNELVKLKGADKIIFDNDLSTTQAYNLAKITGLEVIDRFKLILEIFSERASTTESKLQIRLANLRYMLPHAREAVRLARREEQPGFHGLGKYQVDVYHQEIKRQIHHVQQKLTKISKKRNIHRERRLDLGYSLISLAGYTNAGKSTLFKALSNEDVPIDKKLFTTLSTTTRGVKFEGHLCLLTDTVGFIDRLPLTLVSSFLNTLAETIFSDLIILVVDVSEPVGIICRKIECCRTTLEDIGANHIPTLVVLNKKDLITSDELKENIIALQPVVQDFVVISALREENLDSLERAVIKRLPHHLNLRLILPTNDGASQFLSWLYDRTKVSKVLTIEDRMDIELEVPPRFIGKIQGYVSRLNGEIQINDYARVKSG
jgi:GTP-binding protein HflX